MTQIILCDNTYLHIDGYKSLINFETNHLSLKCRDNILNIRGLNLQIDTFSDISMSIRGKIDSISWGEYS